VVHYIVRFKFVIELVLVRSNFSATATLLGKWRFAFLYHELALDLWLSTILCNLCKIKIGTRVHIEELPFELEQRPMFRSSTVPLKETYLPLLALFSTGA
jgi:hypothetical protein